MVGVRAARTRSFAVRESAFQCCRMRAVHHAIMNLHMHDVDSCNCAVMQPVTTDEWRWGAAASALFMSTSHVHARATRAVAPTGRRVLFDGTQIACMVLHGHMQLTHCNDCMHLCSELLHALSACALNAFGRIGCAPVLSGDLERTVARTSYSPDSTSCLQTCPAT
jgi:hypothetical protein